ncbi:TPA: glycosyltransferase family 4 protein [Clostridium perfringens]|nr:glycosyltransferase family 4 protein [Clostridium perfringens]HAT4126725.1 glycosyltransferase family 4 protein [Clostridium perfringens]
MNVLMIGPDKDKIKGGMSSVIKSYEKSEYLEDINFYFISTVSNGNKLQKIFCCIKAIILMLYYMILKDIKVIHIHTASGMSFYRKKIFVDIGFILKKIVILHIHGGGFKDFYFEKSNIRKQKTITKTLNKCNCIIVLSDNWKNIIEKISKTFIIVINNSINEQEIINRNLKSNRIVFIGRVEKEKGIYDLIEVSKKIVQYNSQIKFIICGDGELENIRILIKRFNLENNFELLGWVDNKDILRELKKAEIFVLPSHKEAMPISILEAMSCGVPIISTKVGSIPEFIIDGKNGFLFNAGNINQFNEKILKILNNEDIRKRISKNNLKDVNEKYSNKINHKNLRKLYFELLK